MNITEYSIKLESETGFDSIPTIENFYERDGTSRLHCPFPNCPRTTNTGQAMWRHVHFSQTHGHSFSMKWKEMEGKLDAEM